MAESNPRYETAFIAEIVADSKRGTPGAAYDPQKNTFLEGNLWKLSNSLIKLWLL